MKKFAIVASLVALTAISLSGCSSAGVAPDESTDTGAAGTNSAEFNALANPDSAASASAEPSSTGAVVDTANPSTTVADNSAYSPPSFTDSAPSKSPVNLGASSAGRAH